MTATTTTAATPSGDPAAGQAASTQQGVPQTGDQGTQGGQDQQGRGQQGDQGTAQHTGDQGTAAASGTAATTPPAEPQPPERYELRLPEQTLLDQSDIEAIAALAKAQKWTNEQAQAALDAMHTGLAQQTARLRAELDAHPEVGGANLEQAQVQANRFMERFLPERDLLDRLRRDMNKSGHGNYLPLVVLFARAGKAMSEDQPGHGIGRPTDGARRSDADVLFGDMPGIAKPSS